MNDTANQFVGSIPENYDNGLGPNIFVDYADDLARRAGAAGASDVLELAAGTGIVSRRLRDALAPDARLTVTDLNPPMLGVAQAKFREDEAVVFTQADAMALPFADRSFDAYTIAFGIRNVTRIEDAVAEAFRVLKPGGRFLCLEFSQIPNPGLQWLYDRYSFNVIPPMGKAVTGDGDSYRYLVESIRKFPDQERFATMIREAGFGQVKYRNLTMGVAALHSGWRL